MRCQGDFNGDGKVDMADYVVWRHNFGAPFTMDDYNTWRQYFGKSLSAGAGFWDRRSRAEGDYTDKYGRHGDVDVFAVARTSRRGSLGNWSDAVMGQSFLISACVLASYGTSQCYRGCPWWFCDR